MVVHISGVCENKYYGCDGHNPLAMVSKKKKWNGKKWAGRWKRHVLFGCGSPTIVFALIVFPTPNVHTMATLSPFSHSSSPRFSLFDFLFIPLEKTNSLQLLSLLLFFTFLPAHGIWKCSNKRENMFLLTQRGSCWKRLSYTAVSFCLTRQIFSFFPLFFYRT